MGKHHVTHLKYYVRYAYHTSLDAESRIDEGSLQQLGSNILETIKFILTKSILRTAPSVSPQAKPTTANVFFDFFGKVLVTYAWTDAEYLNYFIFGINVVIGFIFVIYKFQGIVSNYNLTKLMTLNSSGQKYEFGKLNQIKFVDLLKTSTLASLPFILCFVCQLISFVAGIGLSLLTGFIMSVCHSLVII
jgi:hypothetical protein